MGKGMITMSKVIVVKGKEPEIMVEKGLGIARLEEIEMEEKK